MSKTKITDWIVAASAVGVFYVVAETANEIMTRLDKLIEAVTNPVDTIKTQIRKTTEGTKPRRVFDSIRNRFFKKED